MQYILPLSGQLTLIFPRKQDLKFLAKCLFAFTWDNLRELSKSCYWYKLEKYFSSSSAEKFSQHATRYNFLFLNTVFIISNRIFMLDKQCRPRSNATERDVWSGLHNLPLIKRALDTSIRNKSYFSNLRLSMVKRTCTNTDCRLSIDKRAFDKTASCQQGHRSATLQSIYLKASVQTVWDDASAQYFNERIVVYFPLPDPPYCYTGNRNIQCIHYQTNSSM